MTKYEQYILDHFDELYQTEVDGFKLEDCCDYDENNKPKWLFFCKGEYSILGDYATDSYEIVYNDASGFILKEYKTLKRAMAEVNRRIARDKRLEEDDDE